MNLKLRFLDIMHRPITILRKRMNTICVPGRELKGRSTTSLNDEGKKIWSYTKNNIKSEKAAKVKEEQEKRDQKITELREKAEATKEQISSRLKELNEALTQNASDRRKASILIKILI